MPVTANAHHGSMWDPYNSKKPSDLTTTWGWLASTSGMTVVEKVTPYDFGNLDTMLHWDANWFGNNGDSLGASDNGSRTHVDLVDFTGAHGANKPGIDYLDTGGFYLSTGYIAVNQSSSAGSAHRGEFICGIFTGATAAGLQTTPPVGEEFAQVHVTPPYELFGAGVTGLGVHNPASFPRNSAMHLSVDYALLMNVVFILPGIWSFRVIGRNYVGNCDIVLNHHTTFTSRRVCDEDTRALAGEFDQQV